MNICDWTVEETSLLIQKRLQLFGCTRKDRIYDQISDYLYREHNICQNPSSCQSRFNNVLKTYRMWVKRLAEDANNISKMRFPFFDMFHKYYKNKSGKDSAVGECKMETLANYLYEDNGAGEKKDTIINELGGDAKLPTWLTVDNEPVDWKMRLMQQKLLYYTNQNMLMQDKQHRHHQKHQERARERLTSEEIPKVLRGIHSCLSKTLEVNILPPQANNIAPVEESNNRELMENMEANCDSNGKDESLERAPTLEHSEAVIKRQEKVRLKVRKNIFPAWNRIQTVLLIKIHCDLRPKFKGFNLFECISHKLIELHINRTPRDCRTRWNNLLRSYKECRSRLKLNDNAAVKFEYFDEIDAYYKDRQFLSV